MIQPDAAPADAALQVISVETRADTLPTSSQRSKANG
jgi:hypothetical protein